ncbi:hypothetical protein ACNKF0_19550 [Nocardioides sp. T5]|uniref:hypothetical protein n=1 Tax=Nocardioides sp. T5 TaxID=3400182 RepID=UPI003A88138A
MPDPNSLDLVTGAPAARQVLQDPFWATVLRRHDDVDLVVLPPEAPDRVEVPGDEPTVEPDVARGELRARMAALWAALGLEGEPSHLDDVWFAGSAPGTLRWQGTATFDDLDPVVASDALQRARDLLAEADGWHVLAPPDGVPRVLAGRPGRVGREDVQVLAPTAGRVVLRIRSALVVVGEAAAAEAIGGQR